MATEKNIFVYYRVGALLILLCKKFNSLVGVKKIQHKYSIPIKEKQ